VTKAGCCLQGTAECLACHFNQTVADFCALNALAAGCTAEGTPAPTETVTGAPTPRYLGTGHCCTDATVVCQACLVSLSESEFCAANPLYRAHHAGGCPTAAPTAPPTAPPTEAETPAATLEGVPPPADVPTPHPTPEATLPIPTYAPTKAPTTPTSAPSKAPTKAPTAKALSVCVHTYCIIATVNHHALVKVMHSNNDHALGHAHHQCGYSHADLGCVCHCDSKPFVKRRWDTSV
jgi:hypothetical protein